LLEEPQSDRNTILRREHWTSMVSFLHSQVAALEAKGRLSDVTVNELFDNEMYVSAATGILSIWINVEDGSGSWNAITNDQTVEPWSMSTDGTIELSGQCLDIKSAVEQFAAKLIVS
jgi:hypothetical protein